MTLSRGAATPVSVLQPEPHHGKLIAVIGSKSGVGASTVAINVAACAQQAHPRQAVAVMDLNLYAGDLHLLLGLEPIHRLRALVREPSRLEPTLLMSLLVKHPSGIHFLASDYDGLGDAAPNPELLVRAAQLLCTLFDLVVVDCGTVLNPVTRRVLDHSSAIVLVSTLNVAAMRRAKRMLETLRTSGGNENKLSLVINRYRHENHDVVTASEAVLRQPAAWLIPDDPPVAEAALEQGRPLVALSGRGPLARLYARMTASLMGEPAAAAEPRWRQAWGYVRARWGNESRAA